MGRRRNKQKRNPPSQIPSQGSNPSTDPILLTPQEQLLARAVQSFSVRGEHFSGPLPPPEVLAKYNEVYPGLAERIMVMAENQSQHRQGIETRVINARTRNETLGQIFAFVLSLVFGGGSIWLINLGKSLEGVSSLVSVIVALAGVFIYGRRRQEKELEEKRRALAPKR